MPKHSVRLIIGLVVIVVVTKLLAVITPRRILIVELAVIMSLVIVGLALTAYGTVVRNRWGINFEHFNCPRCKASLPKVRKPGSWRETLWGGVTCDKCGCEIDKWGNPIVT